MERGRGRSRRTGRGEVGWECLGEGGEGGACVEGVLLLEKL